MTPFGSRLRALRRKKGITQQEMAKQLGVSSAYLSALEHGRRGRPTWVMLQRIIGYFNVIWDEAEELEKLAAISNPRVTIDTGGLAPETTRFANLLARNIAGLNSTEIAEMTVQLEQYLKKPS